MKKTRLTKTICYRLYASVIAQVGVYLLFRQFELNGVVLVGDCIQFFGYYVFEWGWNR